MADERYPLLEKHQISVSDAKEAYARFQKRGLLPGDNGFNYSSLPEALYAELCRAFPGCEFRVYNGLNKEHGYKPMIIPCDKAGKPQPVPGALAQAREQFYIANIAGLCPPACDEDGDKSLLN